MPTTIIDIGTPYKGKFFKLAADARAAIKKLSETLNELENFLQKCDTPAQPHKGSDQSDAKAARLNDHSNKSDKKHETTRKKSDLFKDDILQLPELIKNAEKFENAIAKAKDSYDSIRLRQFEQLKKKAKVIQEKAEALRIVSKITLQQTKDAMYQFKLNLEKQHTQLQQMAPLGMDRNDHPFWKIMETMLELKNKAFQHNKKAESDTKPIKFQDFFSTSTFSAETCQHLGIHALNIGGIYSKYDKIHEDVLYVWENNLPEQRKPKVLQIYKEAIEEVTKSCRACDERLKNFKPPVSF